MNFAPVLADGEWRQQFYEGRININRKPAGRSMGESSGKECGEKTMNDGWKVFWLFSVVFAAAFGAERTFVPDIVPVAFAGLPQPLWAVGTAVALRALELISGGVLLIALILMCGVWAEHVRRVQVSAQDRLKARFIEK